MKIKKNLRYYLPLVSLVIIIGLILTFWILYFPNMIRKPISGDRKAIIVGSANDFYRKEGETDFNDGDDSQFSNETGRWPSFIDSPNGYIVQDPNLQGHDSLGVVQFIAKSWGGYVNMEYVFNWTKYFSLIKYAAYNFSAWINITTNTWTPTTIIPPGAGARIGLRWLNSSNYIVKTDWSKGIFDTYTGWTFSNITGIADDPSLEITQLHLILAVEGNMTGTDMVLFDDVKIEYWFPPHIPRPPPNNIDSDGFPAQALQVYWILKNHGYTDNNIFFMLYHTSDNVIDIDAFDGIQNDLIGAIIDVENDDVNSDRFKQELNISNPDSFISSIKPEDQLIIYMVDHGSNRMVGGGNATFHFEADDSYITETEFYNLVKLIDCKRMLINIDICFSGNFLNKNTSIGLSWYNIPNSILVSSSTNLFSWYWRDNNNVEGFAGSWFFHHFWDQLNQNQSIGNAFSYAKDRIPIGQVSSISQIQTPLIRDNLGINNTWSFNSTIQL